MCAHGERAMTGASLLARRGRRDVTVLTGGPDEWAHAHGRAGKRLVPRQLRRHTGDLHAGVDEREQRREADVLRADDHGPGANARAPQLDQLLQQARREHAIRT